MDAIGVDKIREKLRQFEKLGKPVVLLCFEDIRKGAWNWCHRNIFASWWMQHTGEAISELPDESKFKVEPSPKPKVFSKLSSAETQVTSPLSTNPDDSFLNSDDIVEKKLLI